MVLSLAIWSGLRYTDVGKALRAAAEDGPIAVAFGVNRQALALLLSGVCAALAGVAGVCIALSYTLAPAQIYAWIGVVFAAVMMGGLGRPLGPLVAGIVIGVSESVTMALTSPSWAPLVSFSLLIVVLLVRPGKAAVTRVYATMLIVGGVLATFPLLGLPLFYESFLYLVFHWIVLATSWNILSGYSGYFSFGHGAFFGAGMYTTATLASRFDVPFLWTLPAAAIVAILMGVALGAVVFRVRGVRGELFALVTLAFTFVVGTIVLNTPIDGGPGVYLSAVPVPKLGPSPASTFYLMGLAAALATLAIAYGIYRSRLGVGLFAIHDDEDVAEVLGVPTFQCKMAAFAVSCGLAGVAGGMHALFVSYVTAGDTFTITVPLTVVLMSVLGGTRHWAGPAVGRHDHHGAALCVHGERSCGRRQGGLRRGADRGHPVHAARRARRSSRAPPAQGAGAGDSGRHAGMKRRRRRSYPVEAQSTPTASWWRAASGRRFGACAHWTASTSTCGQGKFSACWDPMGRANRRSSISSAVITGLTAARSSSGARTSCIGARTGLRGPASRAPTRSRGPSIT